MNSIWNQTLSEYYIDTLLIWKKEDSELKSKYLIPIIIQDLCTKIF